MRLLPILLFAGILQGQTLLSGIVGSSPPVAGTVATPTFSPAAGAVANPTTVTVSSATPASGVTYCITQDSTTPTGSHGACTNGTLGATTSVTSAVTVEAIGCATGYTCSAAGSAAYTIVSASFGTVPTPTYYGATGSATLTGTSFSAVIGDVLHIFIKIPNNSCASTTVTGWTLTGGETPTLIGSTTGAYVGGCMYDYYAVVTSTATYTVVSTLSNNRQYVGIEIHVLKGTTGTLDGGSVPSCGASPGTNPATATSCTLTTTNAHDIIDACVIPHWYTTADSTFAAGTTGICASGACTATSPGQGEWAIVTTAQTAQAVGFTFTSDEGQIMRAAAFRSQ